MTEGGKRNRIQELWDNYKWCSKHNGNTRRGEKEIIFEEIMTKNFPN